MLATSAPAPLLPSPSPLPAPQICTINKRTDNNPVLFEGDSFELFRKHDVRESKDGPGFIPATFRPGGLRRAVDVEAVTAGVLDFDESPDVDAIIYVLVARGDAFLMHTTWKHTPEAPRLRVIIPLAQPIPAADWPVAWKALVTLFDGVAVVDKHCKGPEHFYYLPSCPAAHLEHADCAPGVGRPMELAKLAGLSIRPTQPGAVAPLPAATVPPIAPPVTRAWEPSEIISLRSLETDQRMIDAFNGRPYTREQGYNATLHAAVSAVVFATGATINEASVVAFFSRTVAKMRASDDPTNETDATVADHYRRAVDDFCRKRAAEAAEKDAYRRVLAPKGPAGGRVPGAPVDDAAASNDDGRGKYSEGELATLAAREGCTAAELEKRWIVQRGNAFFVLRADGYAPPITFNELTASLVRDLSRAPVELSRFNKNGTQGPKPLDVILRDHASVARHGIASFMELRSRYDATTETFHEAAAPLRNLPEQFDPRIDRWLRRLGGDKADGLLDWIATITDLSRPTAAPYLVGPKGTGKTMLAHGLARLWSEGGPTDAGQVLGSNFNSALVDCPLILADEALPGGKFGGSMSGQIRELIGASSHTLTRKGIPAARLVGAVRVFLAANNDRLLSEMMKNEDRSAADIDGVAERFLVIRTPAAAAKFLLELGGREATADWVTGDKIAKHALWLRANRTVTPGGRWLVAGDVGDLRDDLAVSGSVSGLVVEWIAKAISDPAKIRPVLGTPPEFVVGDGAILVRAGFVSGFWETYIVGQKTPSTNAIGRALSSLALDDDEAVKRGGAKYRSIRVDPIVAWADKHGIAPAEEMREKIDAPTK
jgi:hypothetical protein